MAQASVIVNRPPAEVWAYIADIGTMERWDPGVEVVEPVPPLARGSTFTITAQVFGRRVADARIEEFEPGRRIGWKATARGGWITGGGSWVSATYLTEPQDGATRLTRIMHGEARGPLMHLLQPLLLAKARRERAEEISNIKTILEQGSQAGASPAAR
ncbi:MAG TPA: SRPBCC family protein [Candidatus Limnocylindrales bacterium]|jgi:uncharacterized protein YndB with AHSA1/START domain